MIFFPWKLLRNQRLSISPPSPGVALIEGGSIAVGRDATRRARLEPRRIHDGFWRDIDTTTLKRPFPTQLSTADLVHRHLQRIWSEVGADAESVVLAVPGSHDERRLGLILPVDHIPEPDIEQRTLLFGSPVDDLPGGTGVGSAKDHRVVADSPAQVSVVEEDACEGGARRHPDLSPGTSCVGGSQDMASITHNDEVSLDRAGIE